MKKSLFLILASVILLMPLTASAQMVKLENPLKCDDVVCIFESLIRLLLGFVAIFALVMFIWGGFQILTSAGNPERIKKGKDTLVWASLGIVVILGSWAFLNYVLKFFTGSFS